MVCRHRPKEENIQKKSPQRKNRLHYNNGTILIAAPSHNI